MMTIRPGELWVANIAYTNATGSKNRPVLVLWIDGNDCVVAAVTTAAPRTQFDVPLADWRASGLRRPSTVRLARLDCLEQSLFIGRVGAVSSPDADAIKGAWTKHVHPQF